MTVEYATLPSGKVGWYRLKCFYNNDGQYAEFYLNVNPFEHKLQFECKDPWYENVLTEAFHEAMEWY